MLTRNHSAKCLGNILLGSDTMLKAVRNLGYAVAILQLKFGSFVSANVRADECGDYRCCREQGSDHGEADAAHLVVLASVFGIGNGESGVGDTGGGRGGGGRGGYRTADVGARADGDATGRGYHRGGVISVVCRSIAFASPAGESGTDVSQELHSCG